MVSTGPMKLSDFSFDLPESQIATEPMSPRDHSKLLVADLKTQAIQHHVFYELENLLKKGDLLVFNNTRVFPARVFVTHPEKGRIETLFLKSASKDLSKWDCLVKPGKKIKTALDVSLSDGTQATITRNTPDTFQIEFEPKANFFEWIETVGVPPLPPYIKREAEKKDTKSYQTVFAKENGSVAAPTAGLHFTEPLIEKLKLKGIRFAELTLHVGYGTFSPIKVADLKDHQMHEEWYQVPETTLKAIEATKKSGGRVIAVGTTSLRALESIEKFGTQGPTSIFITPGFQFRVIDGLITNFHLPESSLFILISSLLGLEPAKTAYNEAVSHNYRFYSYGDAMLIVSLDDCPT